MRFLSSIHRAAKSLAGLASAVSLCLGIAQITTPAVFAGSIERQGLPVSGVADESAAPTPLVTPVASSSSSGTTYYVDNVNGSDLNSGTSVTSPFQTVGKINSLTLSPGQTVAFKAGEEWHELLFVGHSGTQGSPITYTSYGTGASPIISAADTVGGWTQGGGAGAQETCNYPSFCSGFETPGFADWDTVSNNNDATATMSTAQVHRGSYSMALYSTNGVDTRAGVVKTFQAATSGSTYAIRFYIFAPASGLLPNNTIRVLEFANNSSSVGFASLYTDGSGKISATSMWDTADSSNVIPFTSLTGFTMGAWNEIEFDFTMNANGGGGTLYVNGAQQGPTFTQGRMGSWIGINKLYFGNTAWSSAIGAGRTVYFDDFQLATTGAPIGPMTAGVPSNLWYRSQPTDPRLINFGGQAGTPVSDPSAVTAPYQYAWNGSTLYVYSTVDPSNIVEVPARGTAMASLGASYITVSGLEFRGAQTFDVYCGYSSVACDHWDFENDTFNAGYSNELYFQPFAGVAASGPTVRNSTFKGGGSDGIALAESGSTGATITNNQFFDLCKIYNSAESQNSFCDAIEGFSTTGQDGWGTTVTSNNIYNIGLGQSANYGGAIHADSVNGWDIEHNTIQNTYASGVQLEKGNSNVARYNLMINSGQRAYDAGLMIRAGDGVSISNNIAEYNTSYGGWWACSLLIQQNSGTARANNFTFQKNICDGSSSNTEFYADTLAGGSNDVFTDNNFGVAHPYFIVYGGSAISSYAGLDAALGFASNSVQGDPMFVDPAAGNFNLQPNSPAIGIGALPYP